MIRNSIQNILKIAFDEHDDFGVVLVSGTMTLFYLYNQNRITLLNKTTVDLQKRQSKGGQSQNRIARLAEETRDTYIKRVIEKINSLFINENKSNIIGLLIAGPSELPMKVSNSELIDYRLRKTPIMYQKTATITSDTIYTEIDITKLTDNQDQDLINIWDKLDVCDPIIVYGPASIKKCLKLNLVKNVIYNSDINVDIKQISIDYVTTAKKLSNFSKKLSSFGGVICELWYAYNLDYLE